MRTYLRRFACGIPLALLAGILHWPAMAAGQATDLEAATAALEWRQIGPTIMGGRVADLAVDENDPSTFYVGTATGGLWKTINGGTTFEPVFDDQPTASLGDVTLAPSNPNVVWVGTGEPQNRQSSPWGMGVFRSTDAGLTWEHLGLTNTHHISRIQVHPRDPDVAYVAAVGHLWGSNPERGVYRTTDGGESWEHVLYIDDHTGAIDLVMDHHDPETLFAAMYQRQRALWGFNGGGPGSGIYRTTDGGDNWTELTEGLPNGDMGRIGLEIFRGDGNLVYAIVEADARRPGQGGFGPGAPDRKTGVYKSTDRGETWAQVSTTNNRPMYYSQIWIDPNDPERIYLGGANMYRSSDGGNNFTPDAASEVHSDHHALWINPANSSHLILGGDGGVSISWDRSDNWRQLTNLPLAQFYEIGVDDRDPYHVCGGLQNNGSWCAPSETWSNQGIRPRDWYNVGGGDGFFTVMHPTEPLMLGESQNGNIYRKNLATNEALRMRPIRTPSAAEEAEMDSDDLNYRWNWNAPIVLSSHDPSTIYYGGNHVFKSTDFGQRWEEISPDLTKNIDRTTLSIMGVMGDEPMMSANDGTSTFGNLVSLAESSIDPMVLWAGSDDGNVQVTRDGGATWTNVAPNMPGLPEQVYMTRIVASHGDAGTAWVAGDNHRNDDFAPYVYVTNDFGQSWRAITDGLPDGWSMNALQQHPHAANLLFAGNEIGVYFSIDAGDAWHPLARNLPTVPVDDIQIQARENDLVIGTHGRGIWIMEDITPLEQMSQTVLASDVHLFDTRLATAYNIHTPQGWTPGVFEAENPPRGARIRYWLGTELTADQPVAQGGGGGEENPVGSGPMADGDGSREGGREADGSKATITILDADGGVVRELEGGGARGLHEVIWDLRYEPPAAAPGGGNFFRGRSQAPMVLPGTYTARLNAAGQTAETAVEVRLDPRVQIGMDDLAARQTALMSAYELATPTNEALAAVGRIREQLSEAKGKVEKTADAPESLTEEIEAIEEDLDEIGDELGKARGGAGVTGSLGSYHAAPTANMLWSIERGWAALPGAVERVNTLITTRMPALFDAMSAAGIGTDLGDPIEIPVPPLR
ncbi:MAG: hypothetical protein MJB57_02745 [Gemmatimonadetes bacterium]|nr:hypothetical protein [Gemmatimonadota bacterium]